MLFPSGNTTPKHLAKVQLPVLSPGDIGAVFANGSAQEHGLGSAQSLLPQELRGALVLLERKLTEAAPQFGSSLAIGVSLNPSASHFEAEEFVQKLRSEVLSLYPTSPASGSLDLDTREEREALCIIRDHFMGIASTLLQDGYKRFSVVAARNSFGDSWHVHDFFTYVLYCGREAGTEVVVGAPDRHKLVIRPRKNGWMHRSHDVLGMHEHTTSTTISNTQMGLFLPPDVAHRACHATSPQGKQQANLALVMLAFKD
jgi:hypothetical protein